MVSKGGLISEIVLTSVLLPTKGAKLLLWLLRTEIQIFAQGRDLALFLAMGPKSKVPSNVKPHLGKIWLLFKKFNSITTYFALNLYRSSPPPTILKLLHLLPTELEMLILLPVLTNFRFWVTSCFGPTSGFANLRQYVLIEVNFFKKT